jgi:hypothetical protein
LSARGRGKQAGQIEKVGFAVVAPPAMWWRHQLGEVCLARYGQAADLPAREIVDKILELLLFKARTSYQKQPHDTTITRPDAVSPLSSRNAASGPLMRGPL